MNLREKELQRIDPELRPILTVLFNNDLLQKAFGVSSFAEWYFALNDLRREEFVATTNGGDPSVVVRHLEQYFKRQVQRLTGQSEMLRAFQARLEAAVGECAKIKDKGVESWKDRRTNNGERIKEQLMALYADTKRGREYRQMNAPALAKVLDCTPRSITRLFIYVETQKENAAEGQLAFDALLKKADLNRG